MRLLILLTLLLGVCISVAMAQNSGKMLLDRGVHYIVAFAPVTASPSEKPLPIPMQIVIFAQQSATVRIKLTSPGLAVFDKTVQIDVAANLDFASAVVDIPYAYLMSGAQFKKQLGFDITSTTPISVNTRESWMGNGEESSFLPVNAWGLEYTVASMPSDRYGTTDIKDKLRPGFAMIIASEDDTKVSIFPTVATASGPDLTGISGGSNATVTLNARDVFMIQNFADTSTPYSTSSDLSGTLIRADKPISVVSGHTKCSVLQMPHVLPPTGFFKAEAHFVRNNLHESLLPNSMAGTEFVFAPIKYTTTRRTDTAMPALGMPDQRGDLVRIIALKDQTLVFRRRPDGKGKFYVATLKRGQSYIDSTVILSTVYETTEPTLAFQYGKSWAKVLPGEVKQGSGAVQGHPTVEAGMPCLQTIPGVDKWVSNTHFSPIAGMDNFLNIAFRIKDSAYIYIDKLPLSSYKVPFVEIKDSPYATMSMAIGKGDHSVTSTNDSVTFMAWYNSSLDGLAMGRATGRALGVNFTEPGTDTISIAEGIPALEAPKCGTTEGSVSVSGSTGLSMIYATATTNYNLTVTPFMQGAKEGAYTVSVANKTQPASATVRIVTRTGTFVERNYSYSPKPLTIKDSLVGVASSPRVKICQNISLKNDNSEVVRCSKFIINGQGINLTIDEPLPFEILPGATKNISLCIDGNLYVSKKFDLAAELDCAPQILGQIGIAISNPKFSKTDAVFGTVLPTTTPLIKTVEISNTGTIPLLVDSLGVQSFNSQTHFTFHPTTPPTFNGVIAPGESKSFDIVYSPNGDIGEHTAIILVHTNSTGTDTSIVCTARSSNEVEVEEYPDQDLSLGVVPHPVPLNGSCTVNIPLNTRMRLMDIQGRFIAEIPEQESNSLYLQPKSFGMNAGTYYLVAVGAAQKVIARIVVE